LDYSLNTFRRSAVLMNACGEMLQFPGDTSRFYRYLELLVAELRGMETGGSRILPGGWSTPPANGQSVAGHVLLLFVIHRQHDDSFALSVCNSGKGSEYHVSAPSRRDSVHSDNSYVIT